MRGEALPRIGRSLGVYGLIAALAVLLAVSSMLMLAVASEFDPSVSTTVARMEQNNANSLPGLLCTALLAPVIEETAFRGLMQHHMARFMPAGAAIAIAALLFGLWHRNIPQFIHTFVWGVVFGVVYSATGKVRHTILAHALGNLIAVLGYSTASRAVLGKHALLASVRVWLAELPLVPAVVLLALTVLGIIVTLRAIVRLSSSRLRPA